MKRQCPDCGKKYKRISTHISRSDCEYDTFSQRQHEIVTGLVMGDGSISQQKNGNNPFLQIKSITIPFLEWIQDEFPLWSGSIGLECTAEDRAKRHHETGFNLNANPEKYHDLYRTRINCHPELRQYNEWYENGKVVYDDDIDLTPLTAKVWYCSDGTLEHRPDARSRVVITTVNESHRPDFIKHLFENSGFDTKFASNQLYLSVDESERILNWMGPPISGFEYKWELQ